MGARVVDCRRPGCTVTVENVVDTQAGAPAHSLLVEGTTAGVFRARSFAAYAFPFARMTANVSPAIVVDKTFSLFDMTCLLAWSLKIGLLKNFSQRNDNSSDRFVASGRHSRPFGSPTRRRMPASPSP